MGKLYISLGHDCFVKSYIINNLNQQQTYVFDWLRFYYVKDLIKIFKNNFDDFMNKKDFVSDIEAPIGESVPSENMVHKFNKKFNYTVKHDFTILDNFELIKEKYNRRIARLKKDCKNSETIFIRFIFNGDNINDYLELYKELQNYSKNSILILIHNQANININNENIYLIKYDEYTLYNNENFKNKKVENIISKIQEIVKDSF
tara:strand:+ start:20 stop:631 length:612 start_codon:yes stop_codon:yes gene_type:complete